MHRYVSRDGRTAFGLRRGQPYRRQLPIFGEKVAAMVLGKKKMKSEYRTFPAIFACLVERSDMLIVIDPENGAQRVSSVKRLSETDRRDGEMVLALKGLPWRPRPDEPALDEVPVECRRNQGFQGKTCRQRRGRGPQRSRAGACTSERSMSSGSTGIHPDVRGATPLEQKHRRKATPSSVGPD